MVLGMESFFICLVDSTQCADCFRKPLSITHPPFFTQTHSSVLPLLIPPYLHIQSVFFLLSLPRLFTWQAGGILASLCMRSHCPQADALLPLCQLGKVRRAPRECCCCQLHCLSFVSVYAVAVFTPSVGKIKNRSNSPPHIHWLAVINHFMNCHCIVSYIH